MKKYIKQIMRGVSRLLLALLTRTTVTGLEHIPASGPLLIVANHVSTLDPLLLLAFLPPGTEFVGPGDFQLLFPANLVIRLYGLVLVKRSIQLERASLKLMTDILKSNKMLGLFPEGGTWEKPLTDAKPGAAYLSLTTSAPILPIGVSGTYRAWEKIIRLQRPHLKMAIGSVMSPVVAADRRNRAEALDAATQDMMRRIYDLLLPADQARYDDLAVRKYGLDICVSRHGNQETLSGSAALGEMMLKPNLISPLVRNARLPITPFVAYDKPVAPSAVQLAATSLRQALQATFAGYMEYRLGEAKTAELLQGLETLATLAAQDDVEQIMLMPKSYLAS